MVIFGAMLGVLDPVLTLAAVDMQFQGVMRRTNPAAAQLKQGKDGGGCLTIFCLVEQYHAVVSNVAARRSCFAHDKRVCAECN